MWITGTLVLLGISCYDEEKYRRDVLSMAMLTDEMLLESYHMATSLQLDREFIALLLAEIHRRELMTVSPLLH
ncbi:Sporulation inhibitor sda [compost metagenome]